MKKGELQQFIYSLLKAWEERDVSMISKLYDKNVISHMGDQDVYYEDIINRVDFSKKNFKSVTNNLHDLIVDEDGKVAARIEQIVKSIETGEDKSYQIMALYHIKDNKLIEMWSSFFPHVNYLDNE